MALPQVPVPSQVWISVPTHCVAVGLQATHPPLKHTGVAPEQAPHVAPDLPQVEADSLASGTQLPLVPPLQQPPAQVLALHAQVPAVLSHSPFAQEVHAAPAVPHEVGDCAAQGAQVPVVPPLQHPDGHEVALQTQLPLLMSQTRPAPQTTTVHIVWLVPG